MRKTGCTLSLMSCLTCVLHQHLISEKCFCMVTVWNSYLEEEHVKKKNLQYHCIQLLSLRIVIIRFNDHSAENTKQHYSTLSF